MKLFFASLGCDKNLVDSEYMLGNLAKAGYTITDDEAEAEVIVINTCCFIEEAKEESIHTILELANEKETGNCKILLVAGCLAQRYKEEIQKEIPQVDAILGTNSYEDVTEALEHALQGEFFTLYRQLDEPVEHAANRMLSTGGHYAYLKIAEGCDKSCTYCIIPKLRGHYRSVPIEDLCLQAEELAANGVKELILVAQETTRYGLDLYGERSLHKLLDRLSKIEELVWIRILYCYPEEIYEEMIASIKRNDKVCHYLDLPIQHCNDRLLRRMGRRTTKAALTGIISRLKEEIPDITLRTTLICGFPGETQEAHEELMEFIDEIEFDRLGAFAYSREEDTLAYDFLDQIEEEKKQEWVGDLMALQQEIVFDTNKEWTGETLLVMIEGKVDAEDIYVGRSYRDAPDIDGYVFVHSDEILMSGDFVKIKVTGAADYDLIGEVTKA